MTMFDESFGFVVATVVAKIATVLCMIMTATELRSPRAQSPRRRACQGVKITSAPAA